MKKILMLIGLLCMWALPASAQSLSCPTGYTPKLGETAWGLAEQYKGDPTVWRETIWDQNPQIHGPGRLFTDNQGRIILILKVTDCLRGVNPDGTLQPLPAPLTEIAPIVMSSSDVQPKSNSFWDDNWIWIALVISLLMAIAYLLANRYREEQRNKDPVRSGPPVVEGGVNNDDVAELRLREIAARETGVSAATVRLEGRVRGRIYGLLNVRYGNDTWRERRHNGERAWRALARYGDGRELMVYMLQECGNDIRFANVQDQREGDAFRFVEDVPEVPPAPAPAPVAPAPAAEPVAEGEQVPNGHMHLTFSAADGQRPAMVTAEGVDLQTLTFTQTPEGKVTFRYRPKAPKTEVDSETTS